MAIRSTPVHHVNRLRTVLSLGGIAEPDRMTFGLLVFALFAVAGSHILYAIGTPSLWIDEAVSWQSASGSWEQLYQAARFGQDCGGIVYSAFLKIWVHVFGASEVSLRLPSAFMALIFIGLMVRVGQILWGRRAALYVGLVACFNTQTLIYAREARAYSFLLVFTALAFLGIATYWKGNRRLGVGLLWFSCPLIVLTHVFGFFVVAGLAVSQALVWFWSVGPDRKWRNGICALSPMLVGLLVSLAWSSLMQSRIELIMENFWTTDAAIGSLFSNYRVVLNEWCILVVGATCLAWAQPNGERRIEAVAIVAAALCVTAGPGVVSLMSQGQHHFVFSRYLLPIVPCAALAGGFALSRLGWVPGVAAALFVLWVPLVSPPPHLYVPGAHYGHDIRSASQFLLKQAKPADDVALVPAWNDLTFRYYGFAVPKVVKGERSPFDAWVAGQQTRRLWIVDFGRALARGPHAKRLSACKKQRLYGFDFFVCTREPTSRDKM